MAEVKDYVKRMMEEREEYTEFLEKMIERKCKLLNFLNSNTCKNLSDMQKELLHRQNMRMTGVLVEMRKLRAILSDRIYEEQRNA